MKNFIIEILKKLITTILFAVIMFVASYCLVTGEFPPKLDNMKTGLKNMQTQIQQIKKIQENQLAKLAQSQSITTDQDQAEIKYQKALLEKVKELEARIEALENR